MANVIISTLLIRSGSNMYKLAVLGNPIAHSLSPTVFSLFAKQFNLEINYTKVLCNDDTNFINTVEDLMAKGYTALNITSPYKQTAYKLAQNATSRSKFCQASNLLLPNVDGGVIADTTDGIGLVTDIKVNRHIDISTKRVLIIGSGYVLDSILLDLIAANPLCIDILARNTERVNYLSEKFTTGVFKPNEYYDLILNSSPNVHDNKLFDQISQLGDNTFCYDLTYAKSLFIDKMTALNPRLKSCNGLGMLIEQAVVTFNKLFNKTPNTQQVFEDLARMGHNV